MSNSDGTIILDVRDYMQDGLEVYDAERKKVGTILAFDPDAGYMTVRPHPFSQRFLHVPFSAITHVDAREVFVSQHRDELHRAYASPPPRDLAVKKRTDPDTGEDESLAITCEPSGYDGAPVIVEVANIGRLAHHIAPGFRVWTSELEDLGTIKQYDRAAGQMVVERRLPPTHEVVIPLAAVDVVDREERSVYLAVSSADLQRHVGGSWPMSQED